MLSVVQVGPEYFENALYYKISFLNTVTCKPFLLSEIMQIKTSPLEKSWTSVFIISYMKMLWGLENNTETIRSL